MAVRPEEILEDQEDQIQYISNYKKDNNKDFDEHVYWRPIANNLDPLSNHLVDILREQGMLDDKNHLTMRDIGFFKGLEAAGVKDSDKIIEAIVKYGYIELFEQ